MTQPVDTQFFIPRLPINIAALTNAYEAEAMRALLEMLGCVVTVHWIGTPADFLKVLAQGETAPRYLLIVGHGDDEKGYYFGGYGSFIDTSTSMLDEQHMPAETIAPVVNLPGCTVLSTACAAGNETMGRAFVRNGNINAYIGCRVYQNGTDMCVFAVNFFYNVIRKKLSDHEAWQKAMLATDHAAIYQVSFFNANGTEERYEES
jgi:hypothetical protein